MKTPTKYIVNRKKQHNRAITLESSNIRYFNKLFFKQMLQAVQSGNYTEIFTTDLYNKNGCTYCALLGILNNLKDEVML